MLMLALLIKLIILLIQFVLLVKIRFVTSLYLLNYFETIDGLAVSWNVGYLQLLFIWYTAIDNQYNFLQSIFFMITIFQSIDIFNRKITVILEK